MRRLLEPWVGVAKLYGDWAAYRLAAKARMDSPSGSRSKSGGANKVRGGGKCCMAVIGALGSGIAATHAAVISMWHPSAPNDVSGGRTTCPVCLQWIECPTRRSHRFQWVIWPQFGREVPNIPRTELDRMNNPLRRVCAVEGSVVILDTGATANLVCFRWLNQHNAMLEKVDLARASTCPAHAPFKFGDRSMGGSKLAADISLGSAGANGAFTTFVLDADVPAPLRKGALGALCGRLDCYQDTLALGLRGVEILLRVNDLGRYFLSAVNFGGRHGGVARSPYFPAAMAEWAGVRRRPKLENGGVRLPSTEDGMCSFTPPRTFPACEAAPLSDARDGALSDPKKIIMTLHVNRGRASARKLKRVLEDSEWG